jgi:hypothetical protein
MMTQLAVETQPNYLKVLGFKARSTQPTSYFLPFCPLSPAARGVDFFLSRRLG